MTIAIGVDIETTGLDQERGARIIEVFLSVHDLKQGVMVDSYLQRIDPKCPIDPDAQRVHGIAYSDLVGCPTWEDVAPKIASYIDLPEFLVIHNRGFDGPFIYKEMQRVGVRCTDAKTFCTKEAARWACVDGKYPKLGELCWALGIEYDVAKAHSASYDVERMMACFYAGRARGFFNENGPGQRVPMSQAVNLYTAKEIAA